MLPPCPSPRNNSSNREGKWKCLSRRQAAENDGNYSHRNTQLALAGCGLAVAGKL